MFSNPVTSAREASTDEAAKAEQSYSLEARGKMVFADERYFSYMLEGLGGEGDDFRTYDRKLGRTITLTELVATNDFDVISKQVREYVKIGRERFVPDVMVRLLSISRGNSKGIAAN